MKDFEHFWYEFSPFVYFVLGILAAMYANHLGSAFGVLLMVIAALILIMRWHYRSSFNLANPITANSQRKLQSAQTKRRPVRRYS